MTLQASGAITMTQIHAEFGLGKNIGAYRGVTWWKDDSTTGVFASTGLKLSDFYGKRHDAPVSGGVTTITTGSGNYNVPAYNTLTIEGWGPGGSGASFSTGNGSTGAATTVTGTGVALSAGSGVRGTYALESSGGGTPGAGGAASGGDVNTTGGAGSGTRGGSAPNGLTTAGGVGSSSSSTAQAPGAGGRSDSPYYDGSQYYTYGPGGAGGYFRKVFTFGQPGAPAIAAVLAYSVGLQGTTGPYDGAVGRILFTVA